MKLSSLSTLLLLSLFASAAFAQVPAAAPAGTTGLCKDGSYSNAATKAGACSGHKGIKTWYVAEPTKAEKKVTEKAEAEKKADAKAEKKKDKAAEVKGDKNAEVKAEAKAEAKADKSALEKKGDIKEEKKAEPMKAEPMKATAPAPAPSAAPAAKAAPAATPAAAPATSKTATAPAAGATTNSVWVNTDTKVYHCPGTRFYGKTKIGSYMTEAEATAKGSRPDHGKACGK